MTQTLRYLTLAFLAAAIVANAFSPDLPGHWVKWAADAGAAATALAALFMHPPWSSTGGGNPAPPVA